MFASELPRLNASSFEKHSAFRSIGMRSFLTDLSSRFACRGVYEYYSYEAVCPSFW